MLEFSQYLENYLWPNYRGGGASTHGHMMSIVVMLNEKSRERVAVWQTFETVNQTEFSAFFLQSLEACLVPTQPTESPELREQTELILFLNHCFNSMEVELCREQAKRLISLTMWSSLQPSENIMESQSVTMFLNRYKYRYNFRAARSGA